MDKITEQIFKAIAKLRTLQIKTVDQRKIINGTMWHLNKTLNEIAKIEIENTRKKYQSLSKDKD